MSVIYKGPNSASVSVPAKPFQPNLMLVGMKGASMWKVLALLASIKLGLKDMLGSNTVAYKN